MIAVLLCSTILFSGVFGAKFPADVNRCKYGDTECIKNTINYLFRNKPDGYPEMNLVSFNPLKITSINIKQGEESPVNIDLKFKNSDLFGIEGVTANKIIGFGKDLTGKHEIHLSSDAVTLLGHYDIKGRILVLPISGNGVSNITLANPVLKMSFMGTPIKNKNNKVYMQTKNFKFDISTTRMYMNLDNLFNGDKILGDNMNVFLNENWQDIFKEVKGSITEAFGLIFESMMNNVFVKFPYDELFLPE